MQIGMIGLGRMGANMSLRLMRGGHACVGYDLNAAAVSALAAEGATPAASLADFVAALQRPRNIWIMLPAAFVDGTIEQLVALLSPGDCIIDGGNTHYIDDIRRAAALREHGVHYADVGTSGGVWGLERGYCLMVGAEAAVFERLLPIFRTLAPGVGAAPPTPGRRLGAGTATEGFLLCGPAGAGHFVKMVHNGIEYGLMAAYAEGLNILHHAGAGLATQKHDAETTPLRNPERYQYEFDLAEITEVWRRGSVVASWLLDLTAGALLVDPQLERFSGSVSDSGEGRWTITAAIDTATPAPVLSAALYQRFASRGEDVFGARLLSAMRRAFGGHQEKQGPHQRLDRHQP